MFDWLFEGRRSVYLVLLVAGGLLLALWWRDRRRGWLVGVGVVGLLAGLYLLLDRLVETGREQIERKLTVVVPTAVKERKPDDILAHVAADFRWGAVDRAGFGRLVRANLPRMSSLEIWNIQYPEGRPKAGRPARVTFFIKPKGDVNPTSEWYTRCDAVFVREADGQWRLQQLTVFASPISDAPIQAPAEGGG